MSDKPPLAVTVLNAPYTLQEQPIDSSLFDETFCVPPSTPDALPPRQFLIIGSGGRVLNVIVLVEPLENRGSYSIVPRFIDYPEAWMANLMIEMQRKHNIPLGLTEEKIVDVQRSLFILGYGRTVSDQSDIADTASQTQTAAEAAEGS